MLDPRKSVLDLSCKCHVTSSLHPVVTWEEGFEERLKYGFCGSAPTMEENDYLNNFKNKKMV